MKPRQIEMTAAYTEKEWMRIEQAAFRAYVTLPAVGTSPSKRDKFRRQRAGQVSLACRRFRSAMESETPPKTKDEAIRQVVGLIGRLLAIIFPQYALLISIIGFLWDVSTGNDVTISGVASGAAEGRT
jgi:hypothetical protein